MTHSIKETGFTVTRPDGNKHYVGSEWPLGSSDSSASLSKNLRIPQNLLFEDATLSADTLTERAQTAGYAMHAINETDTTEPAKKVLRKKQLSGVEKYADKSGHQKEVGVIASDIATALSRALGKFKRGDAPSDWCYTFYNKDSDSEHSSVQVQLFPKNTHLSIGSLVITAPQKSTPQATRSESYALAARAFEDNPSINSILVKLPEGSLAPTSLSGEYLVQFHR